MGCEMNVIIHRGDSPKHKYIHRVHTYLDGARDCLLPIFVLYFPDRKPRPRLEIAQVHQLTIDHHVKRALVGVDGAC